MVVLLLAEHTNGALHSATGKALAAAGSLGGEIHVLVAGHNCKPAAQAAARLSGVAKVLIADAPHLEHALAEEVAALIVPLMANYDVLAAPATTSGKNVCPRVAAALDVMQISDVTKIVSADTFERPIYAGNAIQTVQATDAKKVVTVRTASFAAAPARAGGAAPIEMLSVPAAVGISRFEKAEIAKSDRPELTAARMVSTASSGATWSSRHSGISGMSTALPPAAMERTKRTSAGCWRPVCVSPCSTIQPGSRRSFRGR